jgi:CheY-like chemotaxis protein/anti-sigma regulatory factor (Ser/Thr protein kinase)
LLLNADPVRLAQAFSNLLHNACKYSQAESQISINAELQENQVVVSIKDTGIGIPAGMLHKIFEMFTQVDRSLERSQGGLGIGLTLVKRFVELHGGTISVNSDGEGRGSEFLVRLPIPLTLNTLVKKPASPAKSLPPKARRILIVDDNQDAATSLSMLLKLSGNATLMAHDGIDALAKAGDFRPDIILLDIGLPKMNGYDTCRAIRQQAWGKEIVILALTGWGKDEDRRKSQEAGFTDHLVKPIDHAALTKFLTADFPYGGQSNLH